MSSYYLTQSALAWISFFFVFPILGEDTPAGSLLEKHLNSQFAIQTAKRKAAFEKLNGRDSLVKWQAERRGFFLGQLGEFPQRTALKPVVTGHLEGDGYRIEKILFESRPNHHVTASLYLPNSAPPYPAILIPCGHSHTGKAAGQYQRAAILFARNGMAAFCYDPVGQGERYQILGESDASHFVDIPRKLKTPHPRVRHLCTSEHTLMGVGSILLGENFAQYRIWDGMRSIDYLQSRDDIIPDKIGCTGNSGGGTLTSYLMALDPRIVAASPGCYLTTFQRLIDTKGPQDAEQNIFGQIKFGMDAADYVIMRAPSPVLICASTRDATFDIEGTRDVFVQANRFFGQLGYPERVALHEANVPHGYYIQHREAVARWMHRWLLGKEKVIWEKPRHEWPAQVTDEFLRSLSEAVWTPEELYCSPDGQVMMMANERSVFQINSTKAAALITKRQASWNSSSDEGKRKTIREAIGLGEVESAEFENASTTEKEGYTIRGIRMKRKNGIPLSALLYIPSRHTDENILYLHEDGILATEVPTHLVQSGKQVLVAELSGLGATAAGQDHRTWGYGRFGWDNQEIFTAYLMGESFVGMRTEDLLQWRKYFNEKPCSIIAHGQAAIPALHASTLEPQLVKSTTLHDMIRSWEDVLATPEHHNQLVNAVHGVLRNYDLPDLIELTNARLESPALAGMSEERSIWEKKIAKITVGMTRLETETILQPISTAEHSTTLRYWMDENWTVTITYDQSGVDRDKNGVILHSNASRHKVISRPTLTKSKSPFGFFDEF